MPILWSWIGTNTMTIMKYNIMKNSITCYVIYNEDKRIIYLDVNKELNDGILRKLIICNTKISSYICNAIVESKREKIDEEYLGRIYNEILEVSNSVIWNPCIFSLLFSSLIICVIYIALLDIILSNIFISFIDCELKYIKIRVSWLGEQI